MFSMAHVKKIQKASREGNDLDLYKEVERMDKVEWVVNQQTYESLIGSGSIYNIDGESHLVYNSNLIKLTINE